MNALRLSAMLGLLFGVIACSSASGSVALGSRGGNACETNQDCGDGTCVSGECKARGNWVKQVMVETTPVVSSNTGEYGKVRYLKVYDVGAGGKLDVDLEVVADLTVSVRPPQAECQVSGMDLTGNLPVRLGVYQDRWINGIAVAFKDASSDPLGSAKVDGNAVSVSLAPDFADLYIEPMTLAGDVAAEDSDSEACDLAPVLVRGQLIEPGRVTFEHHMALAEHVNVDVRASIGENGKSPLEGWIVDVVEPIDGRRISSRKVLNTPIVDSDGKKAHHRVRLAYNAVLGADAEKLSGTELFRLTPPTGVLAPTHFVARSALDLFGVEEVVIPEDVAIPTPVVVRGLVEAAAGGTPLRADVAAILEPGEDSSTGIMASFQALTRSDDQGRFKLELLSGNYRVTTVPVDGAKYASQTTTWTVAPVPSEQAGKLISIRASAMLTGVVVSQTRQDPLADATVLASPSSLGMRPTFLDELLGRGTTPGVRSQMGMADAAGAYELPIDPGRYDITVRPAKDSGYPWAVHPSTVVQEGILGLQDFQVRNPVAYSGTVTVPGQRADSNRDALPGALLRFFALFDKNDQLAETGVPAVSAIEIGQTRAGTDGEYRLLLPDRLN